MINWNGTNLDSFDYKGENDIKSQIGNTEYPVTITDYVDYIEIETDINDGTESEITEVGVFNQDDTLLYVSFMNQVYKKEEFNFKYILKGNK